MTLRFKLKERIADLEFRKRRVVQLKEIAAVSGVHRVTLSKLANNKLGNVGTATLERLCAYFGCGIGDLVEYVPDDPAGDAERDEPEGHR